MINPEIKIIGREKVVDIEGCLSIPNFEGRVSRYKKIKVKYIDREGKIQKGVFKNQEAREIQHENDHLNGILFTDKLSD
jgi:peptide deformylase